MILFLFLLTTLLLRTQTNSGGDEGQKLAEAARLARQHRFAEADQLVRGVRAPQDLEHAIAFHRLRASIAAGLKRPQESAEEIHAALRLSPLDPSLLKACAVADLVWLDAQLQSSSQPGLKATLADLRALSLPDTERAELRREMGERLLIAQHFREAVIDLSEAARLQDSGDIEVLLGDAYEASGDSVSSARSFQKAIRLSPNEEQFRLAFAVELMRHQTFQPALAVLEQSATDFPRSPRTRTGLGLALFLAGKEQEGTAQLLEAVSLDPTFAPAVHYLAEIALNQSAAPDQRVVKAACDYADAHPSDSESNAYCGGLAARAAAKGPQAADWAVILHRLSAASARSPKSALARCEYARAVDQTHDWTKALSELQACVSLDPDSVEGHYRLARIYQRIGKSDLARRELALYSAAQQKLAASNEAREQSVRRFLYSMTQR